MTSAFDDVRVSYTGAGAQSHALLLREERTRARSFAFGLSALGIHVGLAAAMGTGVLHATASLPAATPSFAMLMPLEIAPEARVEESPARVVPPPRTTRAADMARTVTPAATPAPEAAPRPTRDAPDVAPSPAAATPAIVSAETPAVAPGVVSTEGGLAIAGAAGGGGAGGAGLGNGHGTSTGGTGTGAVAAPAVDLLALRARYRRMLDDAIGVPPPMRGLRERIDVTVIVALTIDSNGKVIASRILESSGHDAIDAHALDFLSELGSLPAPPRELEWGVRAVRYPIRVVVR